MQVWRTLVAYARSAARGRRVVWLYALSGIAMLSVGVAEARIIRIEITSVESPTFEGRTFGSVGPYEKLRGKAYGEVDPTDPHNAVITDIELAPRNANGKVEYSMDIFILKPVDLRRGNHKVFLDMNNRGNMLVLRLNDVAPTNNPTTAADAGSGFIRQRLHHEPGLLGRRQWVGFQREERGCRAHDLASDSQEPRWVEHHRSVIRVH